MLGEFQFVLFDQHVRFIYHVLSHRVLILFEPFSFLRNFTFRFVRSMLFSTTFFQEFSVRILIFHFINSIWFRVSFTALFSTLDFLFLDISFWLGMAFGVCDSSFSCVSWKSLWVSCCCTWSLAFRSFKVWTLSRANETIGRCSGPKVSARRRTLHFS